jgi:hypothetical protein
MRTLLAMAAVVAVALLYGACVFLDAPEKPERSWLGYLALALSAGSVCLAGEYVTERISEGDRVDDPVGKRLGRVAWLVAAVLAVATLLILLLR